MSSRNCSERCGRAESSLQRDAPFPIGPVCSVPLEPGPASGWLPSPRECFYLSCWSGKQAIGGQEAQFCSHPKAVSRSVRLRA